jgi:hypothetical protein
VFAGWDWATGSHDVTVIDAAGTRTDRWALAHTETGIASTLARLRRHGDPAGVPVAIETTRGLVVDRLLAAGHPVIPVHPNAFNAIRPRWGAARAKSDPGDSFKLADYLRTDGHQLRTLAPTLPETLELQALTRQRADHVEARVAAVNQLAALLDEHWPGGKRHPHAVRILARAWLRVIWACWRDKTCYDAAVHQATNKINKTKGLAEETHRCSSGRYRRASSSTPG